MNNQLDERDFANMTAYFGFLLNAHAAGVLPRDNAVALLSEVVREMDSGNLDAVRSTFEQGRKLHLDEATVFLGTSMGPKQARVRLPKPGDRQWPDLKANRELDANSFES